MITFVSLSLPLMLDQRALYNLVGNALKYSRTDVTPEIFITCEKIEKERFDVSSFYRVTVTDNGIGFGTATC
jgi:signal transduction histidine kinase